MDIKTQKCLGKLKISEDVIIDIAANVIRETENVSEYNSDNILKFAVQPAISVKFNNDTAEITALISVSYGCNAVACAENVQEKIKSCVQDMTGVMVSKVNIKIISII